MGPLKSDLVVDTTLDLALETAAAADVRTVVGRYRKQRVEQAALVAVDGQGRVRAMVGGVDYAAAPYNRAVTARRQAGSAWKPFVYLTAMEAGRSPDTLAVDEPVTIDGWSPRNYEDGFMGPTTLEQALAHSLNTVAARLADEVGRPAIAATAHRVGIASPINIDPAMALGTTLVSPLEMAQAYGAFSNGGYRVWAYGIEQVRSATGAVLWRRKPPGAVAVVANPPLSELNRMLRTVVAVGTGIPAQIPGYDIAGKTGTTSDYKDAWFCGFGSNFTTVVWVGRDDGAPMSRITGATAPAELWRTFMTQALRQRAATGHSAGARAAGAASPRDRSTARAIADADKHGRAPAGGLTGQTSRSSTANSAFS
jgi:penicillin-binding protein 1A